MLSLFKKFIKVALEDFGQGNQHFDRRVVATVLDLAEDAGRDFDIFQLQFGYDISGAQIALRSKAFDIAPNNRAVGLREPFGHMMNLL
jgi:hypothetical protein